MQLSDTPEGARGGFRLFNTCRPMALLIEELSDYAAGIGLSKEALHTAAESRLRAARLYEDRGADFAHLNVNAHLYVNVSVVRPAFHVSVQYRKVVCDKFGEEAPATTWQSNSTGTHGGDAGYIVSSLSRRLDEFLAAYLRVNEEACGSSTPRP